MKNITHTLRRTVAVAIIAGIGLASPAMTNAAPPLIQKDRGYVVIEKDQGAFVRITGDTSYGTIKFQFGWSADTDASDDAVGYWVGVYDVTRSGYVWSTDSGPFDTPEQLFRNAVPVEGLQNGEYKVVFFVRSEYNDPSTEFIDETTNVAEIDGLEFTVSNSWG
jgi:hypothetical protein